MPHVVLPDGVAAELKLLKEVNKKHTDDGASSPLTVYLTQNNIDLNKAELNGAKAETMDTSRIFLNNQGKNYYQLRDINFHPVISRLKAEVQYLKGIYHNNPKELVNWGINIEGDTKVNYPSVFGELCITANLFFTKHLSFAAGKSPINDYLLQHHIDVAADKASIATAIAFHNKAVLAIGQAESLIQQRNILWNPSVSYIKGIGNFLMKFYGKNTKGVVNYGYVVDSSVSKAKIVKTKIKLLDKITLKGVVIGGNITNIGAEDVHLYKGKTTTGIPIILKPGEKHGVGKGFSIVTISNPSLLTVANISALRIK